MPTQFSVKRIFWVVLAITLIVWIGVGIYYLTTKKSEKLTKTPSPSSPITQQEFTPWTTEYSSEQPVKEMEGVYDFLDYKNSQFALESDGETYFFTIPKDVKKFIMPGNKLKLRIYYQVKDSKLIFISAKNLQK